ncbi:43979_t:CDS:2, partial [Gigaspora margarita]
PSTDSPLKEIRLNYKITETDKYERQYLVEDYSIIIITIISYLISTIQAGLVVNNPYSDISWESGDEEQIMWSDDKKDPPLSSLNQLNIDLFIGNATYQIKMASIGKNVKGTDLKITYTVPEKVGPPGDSYIEDVSGKIPASAQPDQPQPSSTDHYDPLASYTLPPKVQATTTTSPSAYNSPSSTTQYYSINPTHNNSYNGSDNENGSSNKFTYSTFGFAGSLVIAGLVLGISSIF